MSMIDKKYTHSERDQEKNARKEMVKTRTIINHDAKIYRHFVSH